MPRGVAGAFTAEVRGPLMGDWGAWVGAGTDGIILAAGGMSGLYQMPFSRTFVVATMVNDMWKTPRYAACGELQSQPASYREYRLPRLTQLWTRTSWGHAFGCIYFKHGSSSHEY